ncbi:MAG TPA: biotin transporter BioY [Candidatus Sulfotelmatobacter sp.]|nr:biotin transporter BioY [Candidatus Sulfotelmatobacter sp.]
MRERLLVRPAQAAGDTGWLERRGVAAGIGVAAFASMMVLGAHVRIALPWTPVPFTLQTMFLHLAGATLGPALGAASQALYLGLGAAGLSVFAGGHGGLAWMWSSATTGYLVGFLGAPLVTGRLVRRRPAPGLGWILLSMACGSLVVYACGTAWLAWSLRLHLAQALLQGVAPFLLGDLIKTGAAAALYRGYRRRAGSLFP